MNKKLQLLNTIEKFIKKENRKRNLQRINFDILLNQPEEYIQMILDTEGEKQKSLIDLFSSETFYYANKDYKQKVISLIHTTIDEVVPVLVYFTLSDSIMKKEDGIKFLELLSQYPKKRDKIRKEPIYGLYDVITTEKELRERKDILEITKDIQENSYDDENIDSIGELLDRAPKELLTAPDIKELLTPLMKTKKLRNLSSAYIFLHDKKNYEPRKNLNRLIRAICYGNEENVETTLELAEREAIRTHEKGTRLVGICASSKSPQQAREISVALENPVLLDHKNVIKYMKILSTAEGGKQAYYAKEIAESAAAGFLDLTEKEITTYMKAIAKEKDDKKAYMIMNEIFLYLDGTWPNKTRKERIDYVNGVIEIIKNTTYSFQFEYIPKVETELKEPGKKSLEFIKSIGTAKGWPGLVYAGKLLQEPRFREKESAPEYIKVLTRAKNEIAGYVYSYIMDEIFSENEKGIEYAKALSKSHSEETASLGIIFLNGQYKDSLEQLKRITSSKTEIGAYYCIENALLLKYQNPEKVLPILDAVSQIEDKYFAEEVVNTLDSLTKKEEIINREDVVDLLLPVACAQNKDQLDCLVSMLNNSEMLNQENIIDLEQDILRKASLNYYHPIYLDSGDFLQFMSFLNQEENPEQILSEIIIGSKTPEKSQVVMQKKIGEN